MERGRPVCLRKRFWPPSAREAGDVIGDAGVLPDDGVVDGFAGVAVPDESGLALVGDADGGDVGGKQVAGVEGFGDDEVGVAEDFKRVVLDPAGVGVDLAVFLLGAGDDVAGAVEDHEAGAGGALIEGSEVLWGSCRSFVRLSRGPSYAS